MATARSGGRSELERGDLLGVAAGVGRFQPTVANGTRVRCEIHRCRSGWGVGGVGEREGERKRRGERRGKVRRWSMFYDFSNSWAHPWWCLLSSKEPFLVFSSC